jgi:flagella basal body P-ring formation protein FlgA
LPKHYSKIEFLFSPNSSSGTIKIDSKFYYIKIKAKIPVYKATKIIRQYQKIIPGINVKKEIINFRFFYSPPIEKIPHNLISNKIISKNSIINKSNTEISPDVLRNQTVSVVIPSTNIRIYTTAKALQSGNIGDIIQIEMNGKTFNAKIIKKGEVEIE